MGRKESVLPEPSVLAGMGEYFAAGYFEEPEASPMRRWSRAVRRRLENETPMPYDGGPLYPCGPGRAGPENRILSPDYSFTWGFNREALERCMDGASGAELESLEALGCAMEDECCRTDVIRTEHTVGGRGYTHSIPNYGRVLCEGLNEHARRVDAGLEAARRDGDNTRTDFYCGLQDVVAGIRAWHARLKGAVEEWEGDSPSQRRIVEAFERIPFEPAASFFEAFLAYNYTFYLDDCDNPGRIDQELFPYYEGDVETGRTTYEEALALMQAFTENACVNGGYSAAIGGTTPEGLPAYNELTRVCLEAVEGKHRPSYELRVREDMPDEMWDAALTTLATGCGQPALYNEEAYLSSLRAVDVGVSEEDLAWWCGGGCTETMIHGRSNVGSLDAGIHLPLVLSRTLERCLTTTDSFDVLVDEFKCDVARTVQEIVDDVNADQETRARIRPQPMRSLLIDDCIDSGTEFNAGGARYNWSVINVAGLPNVVDSLAAVREVVFEAGEKSGPELLDVLASDFEGHEKFRKRLARCPRYGNDDPDVDALAADVAGFVFGEFLRHRPWRALSTADRACRGKEDEDVFFVEGRFLPSCIMFETYGYEGEKLGATPDGRHAGEPIADSIGPHQGRDTNGPTAMLRSVTRLPLDLAVGTPVVNIRFSKAMFDSAEHRQRVRELVQTYFKLGGMQIQVSVVDQDVLRDAIKNPERHEDLIVRIGGYSTYFNRLSAELKQAVLERSVHGG